MPVLSIAKGELWMRDGDAAAQAVVSPFAKEVVERDAQSRRNTCGANAVRRTLRWRRPSSCMRAAGSMHACCTTC